ncbi:MAG: acyltransferase [Ignavibacteria bacterium GWA2_35_9]|nr:MAG: acyltransferase [Ignavibacteria bacterium GWA2_35_9]OGU52263.1 MAG: acyltransferase [Ignavibacteria bacterium GWC2_36_12]
MQFNSIDFAIFLPIVYFLYWLVFNKSLRLQNLFLLFCSYFFYAWWDWRFLFLIIGITVVDFFTARQIYKSDSIKTQRFFLWISIIFNLGFLFFFKYYNFFVENFVAGFSLLGIEFNVSTLNILLPLGLSFYVFQSLSYVFDVYLGKIEPTRNIIVYASFLSFFPKLVMGPIEKPGNILPQFSNERKFDYGKTIDGLRQILWGLFKKIVIADNCAVYVNDIFSNYNHYSGSTLFVGALLYAFQIYCDFSGYSDIAIGTARLFSFDLMRNFAYPYFSRNISEFWRRWHISLTQWLTNYIFPPIQMKYRTLGVMGNIIAIISTFLIVGLWHGANWTFIVWGLLNGLYLVFFMLINKDSHPIETILYNRFLPSIKELIQITGTFLITIFAWIFFRSGSIHSAFEYFSKMFSKSLFSLPEVTAPKIFLLISIMIVIEWLQRDKQHGMEFSNLKFPVFVKWAFYYAVIFLIIYFGVSTPKTGFIYVLF